MQWVHGNSVSILFLLFKLREQKTQNRRHNDEQQQQQNEMEKIHTEMKWQRAQKRKMRQQMHYENRAHKQSHIACAFICAEKTKPPKPNGDKMRLFSPKTHASSRSTRYYRHQESVY